MLETILISTGVLFWIALKPRKEKYNDQVISFNLGKTTLIDPNKRYINSNNLYTLKGQTEFMSTGILKYKRK